LAVGRWPLAVGRWPLAVGRRPGYNSLIFFILNLYTNTFGIFNKNPAAFVVLLFSFYFYPAI
jgi:hypothetical protein